MLNNDLAPASRRASEVRLTDADMMPVGAGYCPHYPPTLNRARLADVKEMRHLSMAVSAAPQVSTGVSEEHCPTKRGGWAADLQCLTFVGDIEPKIRYARSGDIHIAYTVTGEGPLDLVLVEGYFTHLGIMWEQPGYRRWVNRLASFARVIRFDKRGMGLSDRVQVGTLEQRMEDLRAVLDAVGSERAVLVGTSEGGPLSLLFAATLPDRTAALVLVGAEVRERVTDDWPWGERTDAQFERELVDIANRWGVLGLSRNRIPASPGRLGPDLRVVEAPGARGGRCWRGDRVQADGVRDRRPRRQWLRARTDLVLHRVGDRICHVGNGRFLAEQIPVPPTASCPVTTTCRG